MADAVVSIVLERLTASIIQELKFLGGVGDQVELAQSELQFMHGYLKDADARQGENEAIRIWVANIRDAAYDLEDVIETFVLKVVTRRKGSSLKRFTGILIEGVYLHKIGSEIARVTTKISKLKLSLPSYNIREMRESGGDTSFQRQQERRRAYPHVIEPHVVGLDSSTKILAMNLIKEKRHRVVSIWGMGGLGKTTLAKQVYNHDEVRRHFDCFAWQEIEKLKKDELAERLCNTIRERKCLVVLDDIWTRDAWNSLEAGFPLNEQTKSRILITTRNKEVASCADDNGFLFQPQSLIDDESWELFQKIAMSGIKDANPKIYARKKELGKKMLQHCIGLPLAITVLAGLLSRKDAIDEWDRVHKNFYAYVRRGTDLELEYKGEGYGGVSWLLALSYDNLPYRLKLCFLYFSHFPEDYEIPVASLTQLWMAEGFISSSSTEMMEDVSYSCLSELVDRCMVLVGKFGSTSKKIKTCRLHDLMRDMCVLKAKEGNFLHIINYSATTVSREKPPTGSIRRLAIYLDKKVDEYAPARGERDGHLRPLLFFIPNYFSVEGDEKLLRSLLKGFKLLRVLKLEHIRGVKRLPSNIGKLVHLRLLSLKDTSIYELPSSIGNLACLQTLDLRTGYTAFDLWIPNVFRKMEQLRHIYLPFRYTESEKLSFATGGNLQTIVKLRIESCDLNDFVMLTCLRKLVVIVNANEVEMEKQKSITFNHLQSLSLDSCGKAIPWNIVLGCPHIHKLQLDGAMTELPADLLRFPNLAMLTLRGIYLTDDNIKILEKLPCLIMLFIDNYYYRTTYKGPLVCSKGGFPRLEFLSLRGLKELKEWTVDKEAMPSLRRLDIEFCPKLTVPEFTNVRITMGLRTRS